MGNDQMGLYSVAVLKVKATPLVWKPSASLGPGWQTELLSVLLYSWLKVNS